PAAGTHTRHAAPRALFFRHEFGAELPLEPGFRPRRAVVAAAGDRLRLHPTTRHRRADRRRAEGISEVRHFNVCVIPAKAGIQSPGTRRQVWVPAFAGMTLTFLSHPSFSTTHATRFRARSE